MNASALLQRVRGRSFFKPCENILLGTVNGTETRLENGHKIIEAQIEVLRERLVKKAEEKGSLLAPEVMEISKKLDSLIVTYQRMMKPLK